AGIERDGPLKQGDGLHARLRGMYPFSPPPYAEVVGLQARWPIPFLQARRDQLADKRLHNLADDFIYRREDIGKVPVEAIRPDMTASGCIDQLGIDPHAVCRPS